MAAATRNIYAYLFYGFFQTLQAGDDKPSLL